MKQKLELIMKQNHLSEAEVLAIIKSGAEGRHKRPVHLPISGKSFYCAVFSDEHVGSKQYLEDLADKAVRVVRKEKPDFALLPGDHLEGMSGRPGHVYELAQIGFESQMDKLLQFYKRLGIPLYGIDGNHDEWYFKKTDVGVVVGNELEKRVEGYTNLGQDEGDLWIRNIHIRLFHPNDGTAFTPGYKLQKYLDSLSGGEKPHIVFQAHYHKAHYMFYRNIHGFDSGTLCGQTKWMKGKKIQAHTGFWMVRVFYDRKGVDSVQSTFYPYYERGRD